MAQSPDVLNKTVQIDSTAMTVIGVLPPGFVYPDRTDLWHLTDAVRSAGTGELCQSLQGVAITYEHSKADCRRQTVGQGC